MSQICQQTCSSSLWLREGIPRFATVAGHTPPSGPYTSCCSGPTMPIFAFPIQTAFIVHVFVGQAFASLFSCQQVHVLHCYPSTTGTPWTPTSLDNSAWNGRPFMSIFTS
ncbi:hypothetical protein JYT72_00625, partial [Crocinitomix catalasitica]|nr:hypothetical protein [Crocinitomix catalasitica]